MTTSTTLPSTGPSPALYPKLLPLLISQLSHSPATPILLPLLQTTLHIIASIQLRPPSAPIPSSTSTVPLQALLDLSSAHPGIIKVPLLIDSLLAYPLYISTTINEIFDRVFEHNPDLVEIFRIDIFPSLLNRLRSNESTFVQIGVATRILLASIRAHEEIVALALEDSEDVFRALSIAYSSLGTSDEVKGVAIKSDILMICRELLSRVGGQGASTEAMLRFMGQGQETHNEQGQDGALRGKGLRSDWEDVFGSGSMSGTLSVDLKSLLEGRRDEEARNDLRVQSVLQLFPGLPPHLILSALSHSHFASLPSGSRATPSEQAAPLLESILNGGEGLPEDLNELKVAVQNLAGQESAIVEQNNGASAVGSPVNGSSGQGQRQENRSRVDRKNIWNEEELDIGRLKLKDDDSALLTLSTAIPDHLRASIMRLVESQAQEEEERRRALREADLLNDDDDDLMGDDDVTGPKGLKVGGGDSDDGEELSEEDGVKISRDQTSAGQSRGPSDKERLNLLRSTYIVNPTLFDRDGITRRSDERKKLRAATGWDDGQIEGWRIMLDRDPHKEAILAAHSERASRARDEQPQNGEATTNGESSSRSSSTRGGRGGRGGNGGGAGGGGRGGGRGGSGSGGGGRGGRGGGGGGGKESKSSRGHSNAARTRGHDRKMRGMGAGAV
nr:uncharacterized protein CI109_005901 [Kwoniella shandongensis]KAA5525738.1 hypothetical protein CI109_005901 [Kwoniella shandongensis]